MQKKSTLNDELEKKHFNAMAKNYEFNYGYDDSFTKYKINKKINKFVTSVKKVIGTSNKITILEIGCGTGAYTFKYAPKLVKAKIIASDISEEMIKIVRKVNGSKKTNIIPRVFNAYTTGLKSQSVDVVCGFYVLHHISTKKVRKEILRILKPGGLVYFYEPNIINPVVFVIKSNKFLKKMIGDSSEEWAINPLKVDSEWRGFETLFCQTTEYVLPLRLLPYSFKKALDVFTDSLFKYIPLLNLIGGSVEIILQKNKKS